MSILARSFTPEVLAELRREMREEAEAIARAIVAEHVATTEQEWIPAAQAARLLGISVDAVRMRVNRKTLVGRRRGRRVEVSAASVRGG